MKDSLKLLTNLIDLFTPPENSPSQFGKGGFRLINGQFLYEKMLRYDKTGRHLTGAPKIGWNALRWPHDQLQFGASGSFLGVHFFCIKELRFFGVGIFLSKSPWIFFSKTQGANCQGTFFEIWYSRDLNNGINVLYTSPKFKSSPLRNGGWKTTFLLGFGNFLRGYVKLREG